jgi:glycerol-3-phosphate dehydrogenase
MAEDTIDQAITVADLDFKPSPTEELHLHGFTNEQNENNQFVFYGSDAVEVEKLCEEKSLNKLLHLNFNIREGEVIWSIRNEMARTVEDFLARRSRSLFLDANASIEMVPAVAKLMADELKRDENWIKEQIESFNQVAKGFVVE